MFIIGLNYDRNDPNEINARINGKSVYMVPTLLEKAFKKHPEIKVYSGEEIEAGCSMEGEFIFHCDMLINTMPNNGMRFIKNNRGGLTVWYDLEECSDPKREFFQDADIIFHPNYNPYQWNLYPKGKTSYLPLANDLEVFHYFPEEEKIYDMAFLGREELKIYGRRTRILNMFEKEGLKTRRGLLPRGLEASREISKGKLTIQISGWDNLEERFFTCGVLRPMLVDYLEEIDLVAKKDKEYISFTTDEECLDKVKYYLKYPKKAEKIFQAQLKNINENHTYNNRVEEVLRILKGGKLDTRGQYLWDKSRAQKLVDPRNPAI